MLKGIRNSIILTSLLYIVLGVVPSVFPEVSLGLACILIGAVTLIYGVVRIVAFVRDGGEASGRFDLFRGCAAGRSGHLPAGLPAGDRIADPHRPGHLYHRGQCFRRKKALDLKALGFERWWVSFLVALALLILGAVMVVRPLAAASVPVIFIGIVFLFDGGFHSGEHCGGRPGLPELSAPQEGLLPKCGRGTACP